MFSFFFKALWLSFKSDSSFDSNQYDIAFFSSDTDRNLTRDGLRFSPIIDSLFEEISNYGYKVVSVSFPFSQITDDKSWSNAKRINKQFLSYSIKKYITKKKNILCFISSGIPL